jgi:hypothetical protein
VEEALAIAAEIGRYPLIIRPAFTCGGTGGGIAYNVDEFKQIVQEGIDASMTSQVCTCVCVHAPAGPRGSPVHSTPGAAVCVLSMAEVRAC